MSITLVCPSCGARWRIIASMVVGDHKETCPVCKQKETKES